MSRSLAGLALVAALLPSVAQPAVYRCVRDGQPVYTDQPCAAGSAAATLPPISATTSGGGHAHGLAEQYDRDAAQEAKQKQAARSESVERYEKQHAQDEAIRKALIERRVIKGMTRAQVERVLNLPLKKEGEGGSSERWLYQDGKAKRTIVFKDGLVVSDATRKSRR